MSNSIDERVVDMRFNNGEFEKGIKESLQSLDALKKGLELDKSAKSLDNLNKIFSKVDFSGLAKGIETISSRFTTMGVIGMRVIQNITDKVLGMSERMIKSVTVDQITAGFSKYAQKTEAVQTIMSATGKTVTEVEEVLSRLNDYTDWTSFNFAEMTTTIGKFTSSGVDLETAERAMEGIGNEASLAGASIQNANHAMYNFAQALATGKVQLMDWKSIENANMATKQFKDTIIETAVELGTLKKGQDGVAKTAKGTVVDFAKFNATLSEGWFTSDVLVKTLEKYADTSTELGQKAFDAAKKAITFGQAIDSVKDAVSTGWMNTFQLIFGNFEEASELWTGFADGIIEVLDTFSSARNELLSGWRNLNGEDGRKILLDGLVEIYQVLSDIFTMVGNVVREFFPPITSENLMAISKGVKEFADNLRDAVHLTEMLVGGGSSLFSAGGPELNLRGNVVEKLEELHGLLKRGSTGDEVKKLQERLIKLGYLDEKGADGIFGPKTQEALKKFQEAAGVAIDGLYGSKTHEALGKALGKALGDSMEESGGPLSEVENKIYSLSSGMEVLRDVFRGFLSVADIGRRTLSLFGNVLKRFVSLFKPLGSFFIKLASTLGRCITSWHDNVVESGFFENTLESITSRLAPFGEKISAVAKWLENLFGVNEGISTFSDLISHMKTFMSQYEWFRKLMSGLESMASKISGFKKSVSDFFNSVFGDKSGLKSAESSIGVFETIVGKIKTVILWLKDNVFSKFSSPFASGNGEGGGSPLDFLGDIGEKFRWVSEKFKDLDLGQIVISVISILAIIKLIKLLLAPSRFLADVAEIPGAIGEFFEGIGKAAKRFGTDTIGTTALKIAGAIAILAGSITLLSMLDQDKMWNSVGALAVMAALMVGVSVALKKFGGLKIRQSVSMVLIAASLVAAAIALKILGELDMDSILRGVLGLALVLAEMVIFSRVANASLTNGLVFKQIGEMLLNVSSAMSSLADLDDAGLKRGLIGLGVLLTELAVYSRIVGDKKLETGMLKMTGLGVAVLMLTLSLKMLSKLSWESIAKGLVGLGGILLSLGLYMKLTNSTFNQNGLLRMVGIGAAVYLLAMSLKTLSSVSWGGIAKGLVGLFGIFAELALFMKMTSGSKSKAGFIKLVGVGIAINLLVKALSSLADMSIGSIAKGLGALGVLMLELAIFMKLTRKGGLGNFASGLGLLAMAEGLLMFVKVLSKLAALSIKDIAKSLAALSVLFVVLSSVTKKISKSGSIKAIGSMMLLVGLGVSINLVVMALKSLSKLKAGRLAKGVLGVQVLLLSLGRFMKKMNGLKIGGTGALASLIGVSAMMIAFATSLTIIGDIPFANILSFAASFALVANAVSAAMNAFGKVKFSTVLGAVGKFAVVAVGITAVITVINTVLGAIDELTGGKFGELMAKGGQVLGGIIGGFVSGIMSAFKTEDSSDRGTIVDGFERLLTQLDGIAGHLSSTFDLFQPFFDKVSGLGEGVTTGIKTLVESALLMTGTGILEDLSRYFTTDNKGGLQAFADSMIEFAPSLNTLADACSEISGDAEGNIGLLEGPLKTLGSVAKSVIMTDLFAFVDQIMDSLTESDVLTEFIDDLAALPTHLNDLASAGSEIGDTSAIANFNSPLNALGNLVGDMLKIGFGEWLVSLADQWTGNASNLISFTDDLIELAPKLKTLSAEAVSGIDPAAITTFSSAMSAVGTMTGSVLKITWSEFLANIADWLNGKDNLGTFIDNLVDIAPKLTALSGSASDLDDGAVTAVSNVASILSALGEAAGKMPKEGGFVQRIFGEIDANKFGSSMVQLGFGLKQYAKAVKAVDDMGVTSDSDPTIIIEKLAELENGLTEHGGFAQWFGGEKDIGVFGQRVAELGGQLSSFSTDIEGLTFDNIDSVITALGQLNTIANTSTFNDPRAAFDNVETLLGLMSESFSTGGFLPTLYSIGEQMMQGISSGFSSADGFDAGALAEQLGGSLENALKSYYSSFSTIGKHLATGLAAGIRLGKSAVVSAAAAIMAAALAALRAAGQIKSPSRVTQGYGRYLDEGLALGLNKYSSVAEIAAEGVMDSTLSSIGTTIGKISTAIQNGIDTTPVITPVLDLSNLSSGFGVVNGMFGQVALAERSTFGGLSRLSFAAGGNADVVAAIYDLNNRLDDVTEAITNMKVVTDTGALVGQISSQMDKALGAREVQKRRLG